MKRHTRIRPIDAPQLTGDVQRQCNALVWKVDMHIHAVVGDPARCLGSSMRQRAEEQKKLDDPNDKRM